MNEWQNIILWANKKTPRLAKADDVVVFNKEANEHTLVSSNPKLHLTYYGKLTDEQNQAIKEKILFSFKSLFP